MSKQCTVPSGETIAQGDAVCVIGFDTTNSRPIVKRATRDNLAASKTVFGVAEDDATTGIVLVLVAGDVAENAVTGLGPGKSRIIATDINNATAAGQCRLVRIDRPDGSEFVVGTCDEEGNLAVQPRASRDTSELHVFNVRSYGAVPDWTPANLDPTDNLPFFRAALAAMAANGNRGAKLVADGHFFLGDTLELTQTIILEGTGQNEPPPFNASTRSAPGTMLVFPKERTGIRIRGGSPLDNPGKTVVTLFPPSAEKTILRNLTVYCKDIDAPTAGCPDAEEPCHPEGACIHGIHASTPVRLENVTVEYFAHDGIHIVGAECGKVLLDEHGDPVLDSEGKPVRVYDGNADGSHVENCTAGQCGRDGFHFSGGDAQTCLISRCSGVVNGRAGFYDATFGNTYLGCHAEANAGPNYITEGDSNSSVFINCWNETGSPPSQFKGQVTVISGSIGGSPESMTMDSSAFILEHGVATRAPLVYRNLAGAKGIAISLGNMSEITQGPGSEMIALQWATLKSAKDPATDDVTQLRYLDSPAAPAGARGHGWWALEHNNSLYRHMMRLPTTRANARLPAPWFVNGVYLGRDDVGPPKVSLTAAPALPATQDSGAPLTYEHGDVVWNSAPSPASRIGQVCIASGTLAASPLVGALTSAPVSAGDTTVKLEKVDVFEPGQYITVGDAADVYSIAKVTPAESTIDIAPAARAEIAVGTAIAFSPARFATFGSVRGTVNVDVSVTTALDARYETIKLSGGLAADTTLTVPSEDGWSARFLDLTTRNGFALRVNAATSPGMADFPLTHGQTQRLYIEYDASVPVYNIRPAAPAA